MREAVKPRQILLSKRANVFYLDHVKVLVKDDRVVYLTEEGDIGRFYESVGDLRMKEIRHRVHENLSRTFPPERPV